MGGAGIYGQFWRWYERARLPKPRFWINDLNPDLYGLYSSLRDQPEFVDALQSRYGRFVPEHSHENNIRLEYERAKSDYVYLQDPAAYWFLSLYADGQFVGRRRPNISSFNPKFFGQLEAFGKPPKLIGARRQLQDATLTNLDYREMVLAKGTDVLLILDPPYPTRHGGLYECELNPLQHEELFALLKEGPHRFIMTYGDSVFAHQQCQRYGFRVSPLPYLYNRSQRGRRKPTHDVCELIISNYEP